MKPVTTNPVSVASAVTDAFSTKGITLPKGVDFAAIGGEEVAKVGMVWSKATDAADLTLGKFADLLYANGIRAVHLIDKDDNKDKRPAVILSVRNVIAYASLTETQRASLDCDAKDRTADQKDSFTGAMRIIKARMSSLKRALSEREVKQDGDPRSLDLLHQRLATALADLVNMTNDAKQKVNISKPDAIAILKEASGKIMALPRKPV